MKKRGSTKLNIDNRLTIQACLHDHLNITQIAHRLDVNKSTISRELRRQQVVKSGNESFCQIRNKLIVCNTCCKKSYCHKTKFYYDYKMANLQAENIRKSSRSHIKNSDGDLKIIDQIVTDGVRLGQSLHHIYVGDVVLQKMCCERTVRRYVYRGILAVKPHQLRRYVRYRRTCTTRNGDYPVKDIRVLIGRTFTDFNRYLSSHKRLNYAEFDSVIGKQEDKQSLLTITFPNWNFQFGRLIKKGNPSSCYLVLKHLFGQLGPELTKQVFPINLCDNGTEFAAFYQLEFDERGEQIHRCFYTNPYKATDKSHCERNHELVRYLLPKSHSLDNLTQEMVNEVFSNINSYVRKSKHDRTPYDLVKEKFGQAFLDIIGIRRIPNKKVKLLPII